MCWIQSRGWKYAGGFEDGPERKHAQQKDLHSAVVKIEDRFNDAPNFCQKAKVRVAFARMCPNRRISSFQHKCQVCPLMYEVLKGLQTSVEASL